LYFLSALSIFSQSFESMISIIDKFYGLQIYAKN
jgi:hypothetical protein